MNIENEDFTSSKKKAKIAKEGKNMAVSMAVVPLLKGDAAKAFIKDINSAHIRPYSSQERKRTIESLENKISEKRSKGFTK